MTSNCNIDDSTFNLSASNPKFFKIILQDTISQGTLAIPKKFVYEYGDLLSSPVILYVPDGRKWKMELGKGGIYEAWLQKGWKEFSDFYSLQHSHMLVFEYQRESSFRVFIFDATLTEIHYPTTPNFILKLEQNPTESNGIEDSGSNNPEAAADRFSSRNPWFKVVLKPVSGVLVPIGFIRDHTEGNTDTIILKVEGSNQCWPIKLIVYLQKCYGCFSSGWSAFVTDNCLKTRDVCVFELVANKTLKVLLGFSPFRLYMSGFIRKRAMIKLIQRRSNFDRK